MVSDVFPSTSNVGKGKGCKLSISDFAIRSPNGVSLASVKQGDAAGSASSSYHQPLFPHISNIGYLINWGEDNIIRVSYIMSPHTSRIRFNVARTISKEGVGVTSGQIPMSAAPSKSLLINLLCPVSSMGKKSSSSTHVKCKELYGGSFLYFRIIIVNLMLLFMLVRK